MTELIVDLAFKTDVGQTRQHNEDYVGFYEPADSAHLVKSGRLFIVADGVGGGAKGEVASAYAVTKVLHEYYRADRSDLGDRLRAAVQAANADVHQYCETHPEVGRMGTTLVAAVVHQDNLLIANVGDSRAYLVRSNEINQITRDHSLVAQMVEAGVITAEEAEGHPQRNVVLRSLGSEAKVQTDIFAGQLELGDRIVLCSDGLTGYVRDQEIMAVVSRGSARQAVKDLVQMANARGGGDNITVLILHVTAITTLEALAGTIHQARLPALPSLEVLAAVPVAQKDTSPLPNQPSSKTRIPIPLIVGGAVVILIAALFAGSLLASRLLPLRGRGDAGGTAAPVEETPLASEAVQGTAVVLAPGTISRATASPEPAASEEPTATMIPASPTPDSTLSGPSCPTTYPITGKGLFDASTDSGANAWCLMWSNGMWDTIVRAQELRICEQCNNPGRIIFAREEQANTQRLYTIDFAKDSLAYVVNPAIYAPDALGETSYGKLVPGCCPGSAGTVVFAEEGGGQSLLWIAAADSADRRPLGNPQLVGSQPVLSPDGTRVAFTRQSAEASEIYVAGVEESGEQLVSTGGQLAWSPDGKWLAFVKHNAESAADVIWKVEVGIGLTLSEPVPITSGEGFKLQLAWSPNGAWIAFVQVPERPIGGKAAFGGLWVVPAGGVAEPFELVEGDAANPVWSPDSGFIAYSRQDGTSVDLWAIGLEQNPRPGLILDTAERDWLLSWQ